jgi:HipA-like protein
MKLWRYESKTPPPTLEVVYQGEAVAQLQKFPQGYMFRYLPAFRRHTLSPFPGLATDKGDLAFEELPAFFQERLPDMRRPEIQELIRVYGIKQENTLELLARVGTHAITDPFELRLAVAA